MTRLASPAALVLALACSSGTGRGAGGIIGMLTGGDDWPGGIGAVLRHSGDHRLTLDEVPSDGPAGGAGLRVGDEITGIDGRPVAGMTVAEVVAALRGDVGSKVKLVVVRGEGGEPFEVELARAPYHGR